MSLKRNKFMITITDLNGSKNYVLSQIIKKFALYFVFLLVMFAVLTALYINYLNKSKEELNEAKIALEKEKLIILEAKEAAVSDLASFESKITEIGEQYGMDLNASIESGSIMSDLEKVVLTGAEEALMFAGVPNGDPTGGAGRLSDTFGSRMHPVLKRTQFHPALDFAVPMGSPIYATADGVIQAVGVQPGYGHSVEIRHNYGFGTRYCHLNGKYNVKVGDFVKKGDVIAYSGNSGLSTGPHLHYEVRFIQKPIDPMNFVKWNRENYKEIFEKEGRVQWQSLVKLLSIQTLNKAQ